MAKKETKKPAKVKPVKEKKGKNKKGDAALSSTGTIPGATSSGMPSTGAATNGVPPAGQPTVPLSAMSPEQMTAAQIEQALKESNDPEARLKKLRSPISVRSCLLNILFLIVLTLAIVTIWCYFRVDKFNFGVVFKHMMDEFKITDFFTDLWHSIVNAFGGGGG